MRLNFSTGAAIERFLFGRIGKMDVGAALKPLRLEQIAGKRQRGSASN